ncbi:isoprenylcysteine carboxylmethyltransferase family protein [bacterium]|nr:isoprenylcysteine carboxylmethyltransferase family protein [bacterium]
MKSNNSLVKIGKFFFRHRGVTPVPFWILLFAYSFFHGDKFYLFDIFLGILLIAAGESIRMFSVKYARSITRIRSQKTGGHLITAGPFRFSRNPIYIGNGLIGAGLTMLSGIPAALPVFAALFLIQYIPIVYFEEAVLAREYGKEYHHYKNSVPRWIGITKLNNIEKLSTGEVYSLQKILKSEIYTILALVIIGSLMMLHNYVSLGL